MQPACFAEMKQFPQNLWLITLPKRIVWVCQDEGLYTGGVCGRSVGALEGVHCTEIQGVLKCRSLNNDDIHIRMNFEVWTKPL